MSNPRGSPRSGDGQSPVIMPKVSLEGCCGNTLDVEMTFISVQWHHANSAPASTSSEPNRIPIIFRSICIRVTQTALYLVHIISHSHPCKYIDVVGGGWFRASLTTAFFTRPALLSHGLLIRLPRVVPHLPPASSLISIQSFQFSPQCLRLRGCF